MLLTDFRFRKPATIVDGPLNGGRVGQYFFSTAQAQNLFPTAFNQELVDGSEKVRKFFLANDNAADETIVSSLSYLWGPVTGDDWIMFAPGTQRDTQDDMDPARWYGAGKLSSDVIAGVSVLIVDLKDNEMKSGTYEIIKGADNIVITDRATYGSGGNLEEHPVLSVVPDGVDPKITITLDGTVLANDYLAEDTTVMSLFNGGDIKSTFDNFVVTSAGDGDYDDTGYPLLLSNKGTKEITVTGTFDDGTNCTFIDDEGFNWGTWNTVVGDFTAINPWNSQIAYRLYKDGLSGTFAADDTIVAQTHPSVVPLWMRRKIPAACTNLTGDGVRSMFGGQGN